MKAVAGAEYQAMAHTAFLLVWLKTFLTELGCDVKLPMQRLQIQAATHIATNSVFHERTKHIEVDCHFVREKVATKVISTPYVKSEDQLADMFTKSLGRQRLQERLSKLGMIDIYAPA